VPLGNPQRFERTQIILLAELYPCSFLWSYFSSACVRSSAPVSTSNLKIWRCATKQRSSPFGEETPEVNLCGSHLLGQFVPLLARLALGVGYRKPETVVAWHRKGFRLFWTWKVRHGQPGRPVIARETRDLIRKMCRENSGWGAPRIHGELLKLGIDIGETSVSKYMVRYRKPPSQTWRTFLESHVSHALELGSATGFTKETIIPQKLPPQFIPEPVTSVTNRNEGIENSWRSSSAPTRWSFEGIPLEPVNLSGHAVLGDCMQRSKGGLAGKLRISEVFRLRGKGFTFWGVDRLIAMSTYGRFHSSLLQLDYGLVAAFSEAQCSIACGSQMNSEVSAAGMSTRIPTYDCALQTTLLAFNHGQRRQDELGRDRR
jgi:hypothetical protein